MAHAPCRLHEHQQPRSHALQLTQVQSLQLPPALTISTGALPDQQALHHHYYNDNDNDQHQDQPHLSLLPHDIVNQLHVQPELEQVLSGRTSLQSPPTEETFPRTTLASSPKGTERGHDVDEKQDSEDENKQERTTARRKTEIAYIADKSRRHITFSKRKAGIMKKASQLSTLTGTQILLLIVSETGLVYTYSTPKFQPFVAKVEGKHLIQACLNEHDFLTAIPDYSPIHRTRQQVHSNVPNINHLHSLQHLHYPPALPSASASLGHLGYNFQHFQPHPATHFPMGATPPYNNAEYRYSQSPQISQYSAFSNTSFVHPAAYWPPFDPSSPPGRPDDHYLPSASDSQQFSDFQNGTQLPSPPMEVPKDWPPTKLEDAPAAAQITSSDERL